MFLLLMKYYNLIEKYKISSSESKNVGMGLIMFYSFAFLAVGQFYIQSYLNYLADNGK